MVCKKSGLVCLSEGIGAGSVSVSARACCHREGVQHGSDLQGGTQARVGWESPVTNELLTEQPTTPLPHPRESLEGKKIKFVAFIRVISFLVFIQFG